jgi:hypothetical protein
VGGLNSEPSPTMIATIEVSLLCLFLKVPLLSILCFVTQQLRYEG